MKRIYLDHAATTPVDRRAIASMKPCFDRDFGNASSLYHHGQQARIAIEDARKKAARLINAESEEIIFNSGGTESDNTALVGIAMANKGRGNHIITTKIEHHAVLETCHYLEGQGFEVTYLDVDKEGLVYLEDVRKAIRDKTILVSVMHVNNEIGTIEPIGKMGRLCRENGVYFHTDAVQGFGKLPIDVKGMKIDLLTASSHKIYGPKGVGLLFVRKGVKMDSLVRGGSQENKRRAGTENVPGIVGFGRACEIAGQEMEEEAGRLTELRERLVDGVMKIPGSYLNGHPKERLPGNASFRFDGIEGEAMILRLDALGIEASTGSACSSRELKPSHVLTSIGLRPEQAHGSLRITLGRGTTMEDVRYVLEKLPGVIQDLRKISPYGHKEM